MLLGSSSLGTEALPLWAWPLPTPNLSIQLAIYSSLFLTPDLCVHIKVMFKNRLITSYLSEKSDSGLVSDNLSFK